MGRSRVERWQPPYPVDPSTYRKHKPFIPVCKPQEPGSACRRCYNGEDSSCRLPGRKMTYAELLHKYPDYQKCWEKDCVVHPRFRSQRDWHIKDTVSMLLDSVPEPDRGCPTPYPAVGKRKNMLPIDDVERMARTRLVPCFRFEQCPRGLSWLDGDAYYPFYEWNYAHNF